MMSKSSISLKKMLVGIGIVIGGLALCIILGFLFLFGVMFGFGSGMSLSDQNDAKEFCRKLHADALKTNFIGFMSYDEMHTSFQDIAPKAIRSTNFGFKRNDTFSQCCFISTESGNTDWGYVDCLRQSDRGEEFIPKVKSFGYPSSPELECRIGRKFSYEGKLNCINMGL
jgi:hypothetical protein